MECRKTRRGRLCFLPDSILAYSPVFVDVFSVAAGLADPVELFRGFAEAGLEAVFYVDAWSETQLGLARRYISLCREYGLECRLAERRPAELEALETCEEEAARGRRAALLTRDLEPALRAERCVVLVPRRGTVYRVYRWEKG